MHEFFRVGLWRISENGRGFETGTPTTGLVTLSFEQVAGLLVTHEPALQDFLRQLSAAMHNRFGDNKFLEETVASHNIRHPQMPVLKVPDHRTPQPRDKDDGY